MKRSLFVQIAPVILIPMLFLNCGTDDPASRLNGSKNYEGTDYVNDNGVSPDYIPTGSSDVGTSKFDDGSAARMALYGEPQYFWGDLGNGDVPIVKITHAISSQVVDVEAVFSPYFVDNTYGTGSVGWNPNRPHTFRDLHVSDHVELAVTNGDGDTVWKGRLDLLSQTDKVSSGYACLGPFGGDGRIDIGSAEDVLSFGSSLDDNINYYGYQLLENSPPTDSVYTMNSKYPYWQYYVSYRLTLDKSIFGLSGYGEVRMTSVHASPGKDGNETVMVSDQTEPVPGSPQDPFRFYTTVKPSIPGDDTPPDTTDIPIDTTEVPPDTVDGVD